MVNAINDQLNFSFKPAKISRFIDFCSRFFGHSFSLRMGSDSGLKEIIGVELFQTYRRDLRSTKFLDRQFFKELESVSREP